MNEDLRLSLARNAQEWLELSLSISSAEKISFDKIHDGFLASHGAVFMVNVYRRTFEHMLQNTPETERNKLILAFKEAMEAAKADTTAARPR